VTCVESIFIRVKDTTLGKYSQGICPDAKQLMLINSPVVSSLIVILFERTLISERDPWVDYAPLAGNRENITWKISGIMSRI
jgi:hypothetical protein